ncbi:MAG: succinylglutamate desuccinylase/aspartoacylase family protein [Deltaproteobacteria bacterium]|nr:succinylglutamate desuccinylase/aspartoacylase family protein [Deltaproteobacteria bacterium]
MDENIFIGDYEIPPGKRQRLELPLARLFTGTPLGVPVTVVNGRHSGPRVFLTSTLHGDELNGIEIIRQVMSRLSAKNLRGAVIAVPVVNVFGFVHQTRYLPDRRDLNRSFPGSKRGSLAARLAHLLMNEVIQQCDYGLDFHTGSHHRSNLPQIRAELENEAIRSLAEAFSAPLIIDANSINGSLRGAARNVDIPVITYEAGQPLRFSSSAISEGINGSLRVLEHLEMIEPSEETSPPLPAAEPLIASKTRWLRASRSGIFRLATNLGDRLEKNQILGEISNPFSSKVYKIRARHDGVIIGYTNNPLVHQGDALLHLAEV